MLQNESVDEELEHFEDVKEESDNDSAKTNKQLNDIKSQIAEAESSSSEDDAPGSSSDDEAPEVEDEFLLKNVQEDGELSRDLSDNKHHSTVNSSVSVLPGGYNPRHREPSYR